MEYGVGLSVVACRKALEQWGGDVSEITHMVSTTCTNSANPGFDHFVVKKLGLRTSIEKVLLHGVGCSGGLAALRTAANIALGSSFRGKPARILVLACEISSVLVRSELDSIHRNQEVRIGVTLFSDCASAVVIGNGFSNRLVEESLLELLGWEHRIIDGTAKELGFKIDPLGVFVVFNVLAFITKQLSGWKVVLTKRVPELTSAAISGLFQDLISSTKDAVDIEAPNATDFDWALHPGGATIMSGVQNAMNLTDDNLRASYEVYVTHGNSSSAAIFSVLDRVLSTGEGRDHVVGCAFGPGIAIEMMLFKKSQGSRSSSTPRGEPIAEDID